MEEHGVVRAGFLRSFGRFVATFPALDAGALLREVGIPASVIHDPAGTFDVRQGVALLDACARETGDESFGLQYGAQIPWKDIGVLGHVVLSSPTIGAAFGNAGRYFALQQTLGRITIEVRGSRARVRFTIGDPSIRAHPQNTELVLGVLTRICRDGIGDPAWAPYSVHVRHQPRGIAAQEKYFGAPFLTGQRTDALIVTAAQLRTPLRTADDDLLPILIRHADECLARLPHEHDFLADVRRVVIDLLGARDVTIGRVGARLGMSARSLQRRLQAEGHAFKDVVAETRLALAKRYLEDRSLSLTDCAFLLGYSELSAFSRAYKRWTGRSPGTR